jgi:single-strand DNA-binding protein
MLMGNITRDLAMTYLPSNTPVVDFGIATNRTWTGQDGVKKEEVTFVDCVAFGKQAEILAKFKKKGDPLFVEGRLKLEQWQAQDGTSRSKLRVIVENFQFLNRAGSDNQQDHAEEAYQPAPSPVHNQVVAAAASRPASARPAPAQEQTEDIPF